jgi:hypothetical protein
MLGYWGRDRIGWGTWAETGYAGYWGRARIGWGYWGRDMIGKETRPETE